MIPRFLNKRRLSTYPRLVLLAMCGVEGFNVLFRQGWRGGLGQILGIDFIILYASGFLYRTDIVHLYDFPKQQAIEQQLIWPTLLPGSGPFSNPPHVAWAYSAFTHLPLLWAFLLWLALTLVFLFSAVHLSVRFLAPRWLVEAGLSRFGLMIILLSFFPFLEGFQSGQSSGLTLLLISGVTISTLAGRGYSAGILAGLLLYKPQFVLGFLIVWVIWREYRALGSFVTVALGWAGVVIASHGFEPYFAYRRTLGQVLLLPYVEGWPAYLLTTPYGFLVTLVPQDFLPATLWVNRFLTVAASLGLAWFAYRWRRVPSSDRQLPLVLALLFPLLATPYVLLHDLLIVVPIFLLLAADREIAEQLLYAAIFTYFGVLPLLLFGQGFNLALFFLIPAVLLALLLRSSMRPDVPNSNPITPGNDALNRAGIGGRAEP